MSISKISFSKKTAAITGLIYIAFSLFFMMSPLAFAQSTPPDQQDRQAASQGGSSSQNPIVHDIQIIVNFLAAGVGIVVVGTIILGAIQYIASGDSPEGVNKAKQRITNGLIALLAFIFTFAFLQWLIPGGVF